MPAYTFYYDGPIEVGQTFSLNRDESHHALHVMRLKIADTFMVINGAGTWAQSRIISSKPLCEGQVESIIKYEPKNSITLSIAQGLTALNKADLIVEKLTELGADEIIFFAGDKSSRQILNEHQLQKLKVKSIGALKQCGRLYLPKILWLNRLEDLQLNSQILTMSLELTAKSLNSISPISTTAIIGPEAGLSDQELIWLQAHHAQPISLHQHILRSETASIVTCAFLNQILSSPR
jgi:16S rRNA (uracil1498-N3)-methyltransferase